MNKYVKIQTQNFNGTNSKGRVVKDAVMFLEINLDSKYVKEADHEYKPVIIHTIENQYFVDLPVELENKIPAKDWDLVKSQLN